MRKATYLETLLFYLDYFEEYRVEGDSMLPTLKDGDRVMVQSIESYQTGDVVVAKHPFRHTPIIKRIAKISTGGKFFLAGDNPDESKDSRSFGEIQVKDILGKVICRLR